MQTDRHDEADIFFHNIANAPKKCKLKWPHTRQFCLSSYVNWGGWNPELWTPHTQGWWESESKLIATISLHDQNIDVWCTVLRNQSTWPHPFENIISSDQQTNGSLSWNFLGPFITGWRHRTPSIFRCPVWWKTDFRVTFKWWGPGFITYRYCLREAVEENCTDILTHYPNIFQEFLESMSIVHIIFWLGLWHIYGHMTCRHKYANLWRQFPKFAVNSVMKIVLYSQNVSNYMCRGTCGLLCITDAWYSPVSYLCYISLWCLLFFYFFLVPEYCVLCYCK